MLSVKKLDPNAKLPTVAHPGEDIAYDIYALDETILWTGETAKIRTGIAAQAFDGWDNPLGLLIRDRSSLAAEGITVSGGVIDHGYTGEIIVMLTLSKAAKLDGKLFQTHRKISAGDKIAQMIPVHNLTGPVEEVADLDESSRGDKGFGSSGK